MGLFLQKRANYFAFLVVFSLANTSYSSQLLPEFTAYEEQYSNVLDDLRHIILSSSPKRISNAIVIDAQHEVEGVRVNRLISVPRRYDIKDVFEFYLAALQGRSENVFQCRKRSCGSSNYWANDFFKERRLYGRDSEQFFVSGKLKSSTLDMWYMIYVVQNGLKQNLVYITTVTKSSEEAGFKNGMLYLNPLSEMTREGLKAALRESETTDLWVVAFSDRNNRIGIDGELESLRREAENKRQNLMTSLSKGDDRIRSAVVGPFHTEDSSGGNGPWYRLFLTE